MYKAKFYTDVTKPLEGITSGQLWNGWSTPFFPLESVNKIIESMSREQIKESNGDFYYWLNGVLMVDYYTDDIIEESNEVATIEHEGVIYWNIGDSWTWSELIPITAADIIEGAKFKCGSIVWNIDKIEPRKNCISVYTSMQHGEKGRYRDDLQTVINTLNEENAIKL